MKTKRESTPCRYCRKQIQIKLSAKVYDLVDVCDRCFARLGWNPVTTSEMVSRRLWARARKAKQ